MRDLGVNQLLGYLPRDDFVTIASLEIHPLLGYIPIVRYEYGELNILNYLHTISIHFYLCIMISISKSKHKEQ